MRRPTVASHLIGLQQSAGLESVYSHTDTDTLFKACTEAYEDSQWITIIISLFLHILNKISQMWLWSKGNTVNSIKQLHYSCVLSNARCCSRNKNSDKWLQSAAAYYPVQHPRHFEGRSVAGAAVKINSENRWQLNFHAVVWSPHRCITKFVSYRIYFLVKAALGDTFTAVSAKVKARLSHSDDSAALGPKKQKKEENEAVSQFLSFNSLTRRTHISKWRFLEAKNGYRATWKKENKKIVVGIKRCLQSALTRGRGVKSAVAFKINEVPKACPWIEVIQGSAALLWMCTQRL